MIHHAAKGTLQHGFPYHDVKLGVKDRNCGQSIVWDLIVEGITRPGNKDTMSELPFYHVTEFGLSRISHEGERPTPYESNFELVARYQGIVNGTDNDWAPRCRDLRLLGRGGQGVDGLGVGVWGRTSAWTPYLSNRRKPTSPCPMGSVIQDHGEHRARMGQYR
jgi:hypothetical protein